MLCSLPRWSLLCLRQSYRKADREGLAKSSSRLTAAALPPWTRLACSSWPWASLSAWPLTWRAPPQFSWLLRQASWFLRQASWLLWQASWVRRTCFGPPSTRQFSRKRPPGPEPMPSRASRPDRLGDRASWSALRAISYWQLCLFGSHCPFSPFVLSALGRPRP